MLLTTVMRTALATTLVAAFVTVLPLRAWSHPSDFQTLTIDLLFGGEGLEAIDAAVVESSGPTWEPFPSVELRDRVARDVLAALDLSGSAASIDSEMSERYHQVGFFVVMDKEQLEGNEFIVNTAPLQAIAADTNLEQLKLSVCSEDSETFNDLEIDATREGRDPIRNNRNERSSCQVWEIAVDDPPVTVTVTTPSLPMTGLSLNGALTLALTLTITGLTIVTIDRRRRMFG